ncbi:AbrB/MazE/SpoVT family DNA-binding domain-containing protein [Geodermatophilus sp. URMC 61]|uniref:AbrB/MazE/SpoVT family DNA-binding domain-containing protein n=1 Tax=Geodermatophilus sp. URMC 61 TaxID=3423411 RepID=UPI00406CBB3F
MPTSTVTSKRQITIPLEVRHRLGLAPGTRITFVLTDRGSYEIVPATNTVRTLKGRVPAPARPVSLEEMDAAVADAARRAAAR